MSRLVVVLFVMCMVLGARSQAAVIFTFSGVITSSDGAAFEVGENVTFTFTAREDLGAPNFTNTASALEWYMVSTEGDPSIWSNVTISGTSGTWNPWSDPVATVVDDLAAYDATQGDYDYLESYSDGVNGIGLTRNGVVIRNVVAYLSHIAEAFNFPDPATNVGEVVNDGTYTATNVDSSIHGSDDSTYSINVTQMTIAQTPEPTVGALALAGAGGMLLRRRFRRSL